MNLMRLLVRFVTEAFLMRHGRWDEANGEPCNLWAEEFDFRQRAAMAAAEGGDKP